MNEWDGVKDWLVSEWASNWLRSFHLLQNNGHRHYPKEFHVSTVVIYKLVCLWTLKKGERKTVIISFSLYFIFIETFK